MLNISVLYQDLPRKHRNFNLLHQLTLETHITWFLIDPISLLRKTNSPICTLSSPMSNLEIKFFTRVYILFLKNSWSPVASSPNTVTDAEPSTIIRMSNLTEHCAFGTTTASTKISKN